MREEKISIFNKLVNYKIAGEGPAILILHGWGGSSASWVAVQQHLVQKGYKVIIPDLPGFGKSVTSENPWGVGEYMVWLDKFLEELKIAKKELDDNPFFLVGHSFGGRISVKFVHNFPEKVKALILCDSAGIKPKRDLNTRFIFLLVRIGNALFTPRHMQRFKDGLKNLFYILIRNKDYVKAEGNMRETIKKVLSEDLLPELPGIKKNTLIVWGEKDKMVPLEYAYIFKEKIQGSDLIVLPKVGHSPHLETPSQLSEIISNFFKKFQG